jgi:hypothetical protein
VSESISRQSKESAVSESKGPFGGSGGIKIPTLPVRLLYRIASTHAFTERGMYLNLGYWPKARTIDEACEAMVELVGQTAGLTSEKMRS